MQRHGPDHSAASLRPEAREWHTPSLTSRLRVCYSFVRQPLRPVNSREPLLFVCPQPFLPLLPASECKQVQVPFPQGRIRFPVPARLADYYDLPLATTTTTCSCQTASC